MPGQHDTTPIQTVIYRPNEHADEYIVAIDDVAEVSRGPLIRPHIHLFQPCTFLYRTAKQSTR